MTIKSDRWIRRMALEHGMIEPFVENQVRDGVISYGNSSYGYDMRIADEFKVFTNVFNTLVDPKHFDPRSFVDIKADYCDIPPNSFALARSVEFFRIPRNVLAVCLGKSTYARCFRGDTRVALVDNTNPTFYEMAERAQTGEQFWGYGIDTDRRIVVSELVDPRWIGRDSLIEIELDTGECIQCTPDHRFLLRNGLYDLAANLRPGDRLMPLYRGVKRDYEAVMQLDGSGWYPTHRLSDEWNILHGIYKADMLDFDRHHLDGNRRNNRPTNVVRMDSTEHAQLHNYLNVGSPARSLAQHRSNHVVVGVRYISGEHDVFCCTAPDTENFALTCGVFVHNCGIIVNTTPFEPGWRGYVTIELSNSTPLPARIYANEGIGQVLFFESDEDCEISYDEKKGKYLDQVGVVPPRL